MELLEVIRKFNRVEWVILYNRYYVEELPKAFLDRFVKGKIFKDNYVIAGMSKQDVLDVSLDTMGYTVCGKLWNKSLVV